ncbi:MAG: tetratricopeptide repeat protein [Deltaproteobacteria bacterium]|jgi:tetratricopeptide (TPR) repeat protein
MRKAFGPLAYLLMVVFLSSCSIRTFNPGYDSFERGLALFNQGRFDSAVAHFERATRENPNDAQAYLYLGRSYISLSRWRSAIQPLRTAFRLSPENAKEEVMNLLVDALFAAALNDFNLGDKIAPPQQLKEIL